MNYKIKKDVLWKIVEDEAVIVESEKDVYSYLNQTGTEIWKMIDQNCDLQTIQKTLLEKYDSDEQTLKQDISDVIDQLLEQDLIEKNED